jgi:pimeloyl-ACP methyl ester carboxylesterase
MKVWPKLTLTIVAVPESLVPTLSPDARANLDRATSGILPVSRRRKGILYDSRNQMTIEPYPIDRISVPTLLVSAEDDLFGTLANARAAAAGIPGARLVAYASGGHLLLGRDDELWPLVADFILGGTPKTNRLR